MYVLRDVTMRGWILIRWTACSRRGSSCVPCSVRRVCLSQSWRRSPSRNGCITREQLMESAERYGESPYGRHLKSIADGEIMLVSNQKS